MAVKTIAAHLGLNPPNKYVVPNKVIAPGGVDPHLLYGVELEIEGLDSESDDRARRIVAGMQYHSDGSLRNNGGEYVTEPMDFSTLEYTLNQFFQKNKLDEENYSERCSVHVHANCCDLELEQLRLILCLYQILERVLFNYIKQDRDKNIFCVPWSEAIIGSRMFHSEMQLLKAISGGRWQKYSALNLLPLRSFGTIEFRHMGGTQDLNYILQWCNIIGSLFKYARENTFDKVIDSMMKLNTSSAYASFMQSIFSPEIYDVLAVGNFRECLEEGVINMKVMLCDGGDKKINYAAPARNPFGPDDLVDRYTREDLEDPFFWGAVRPYGRNDERPYIHTDQSALVTAALSSDNLNHSFWRELATRRRDAARPVIAPAPLMNDAVHPQQIPLGNWIVVQVPQNPRAANMQENPGPNAAEFRVNMNRVPLRRR